MMNRSWSDRFLDTAIYVIGASVIEIASEHLDQKEATDLLLTCPTRFSSAHYAVRVRRHNYLADYGFQFTIRSRSANGGRTELEKIMSGKGDLMLFAFAGPENTGFAKYTIIDLDQFRNWADGRTHLFKHIPNSSDGTTFCAFDLRQMPREMVVKSGTNFMTSHSVDCDFQAPSLLKCSAVHPAGFY
jgi:hypothetical protein